MRLSTRIAGKVSSVSVNAAVLSAHYALSGSSRHIDDYARDVCLPICDKWLGVNAKGLSSHVTEVLLGQILPEEFQKIFNRVLESIRDTE